MAIQKYIDKLGSFDDRKIVLIGGTFGIGLELLKHLVKIINQSLNANESQLNRK